MYLNENKTMILTLNCKNTTTAKEYKETQSILEAINDAKEVESVVIEGDYFDKLNLPLLATTVKQQFNAYKVKLITKNTPPERYLKQITNIERIEWKKNRPQFFCYIMENNNIIMNFQPKEIKVDDGMKLFNKLLTVNKYNPIVNTYYTQLVEAIKNKKNATKISLGGICLPGFVHYLIANKLSTNNHNLEINLTTYAMPLQDCLPEIENVIWKKYYNPRDTVPTIVAPFIPHPDYSSTFIHLITSALFTLIIIKIYIYLNISLSLFNIAKAFFASILFIRLIQYQRLEKISKPQLVPLIKRPAFTLNRHYKTMQELHMNVWWEQPAEKVIDKLFFIPDNNNNIDNINFANNQTNIETNTNNLKEIIISEYKKDNKPVWLIGHGKGGHIARKAAECLAIEKPNIKINLVTIATALQQWEKKPNNVVKWYKFHNRYDLTQKFRAFFASHKKYSKHSYLISLVIEIFIVQICNIYSFNISILSAFILFVAIMFLHRFLEYNFISHDNTSVHIPTYNFDFHNSIKNSCTRDTILEHLQQDINEDTPDDEKHKLQK